jgi:phage FluMu protein Com
MSRENYIYTWRCAKCFFHFANIAKIEGLLKEEKKCPKCKSLNILTLSNKEIIIHCKLFDATTNGYQNEINEVYNFNNENDY